jgi:hypothetical protein
VGETTGMRQGAWDEVTREVNLFGWGNIAESFGRSKIVEPRGNGIFDSLCGEALSYHK